ncbi:hypothetical protein ACJIZ3_011387 [Penstemon smallii]|uniref:Ubiquitin receptor RAD23 n=1 Tax=Penstemon smallii TaxID=265156 RepID=A0ABD3UMJ3_9LAMI
MKLTVKTNKGSHFQINVHQDDTIMAVKKNIEDAQGKDNYPCGQQFLIHNGKVLKDESTLAQNKVSEDGFLVVTLSKGKMLSSSESTSSQPAPITALATNPTPEALAPLQTPKSTGSTFVAQTASDPSNLDAEVASNLVGRNNFDQIIQQLIDMGGGRWGRETVIRALRAAYNNPERAVDYLYSGIPESTEVAVPLVQPAVNLASGRVDVVPASGASKSSPLNLFPQEVVSGAAGGGIGSLDFLKKNGQFQALRTMVQSNPQILQPMLQELRKQNPSLLRHIQENHQEFLRLINEPVDSSEEDTSDEAEEDMSHDVNVTPAEQKAIERMEAMGFARAFVIEAFFACDRNEELAVNYLLENAP